MKAREWFLPTLLLAAAVFLTGAGRRDRDSSLLSFSSNNIVLERLKKQLSGLEIDQKLAQKLRVLEDANDKIVLNLLREKPEDYDNDLLAGLWSSHGVPQKEKEVFVYLNLLEERGLRLPHSSQYYRRSMEEVILGDSIWRDRSVKNLFLYTIYRDEPRSRQMIRILVFEK